VRLPYLQGVMDRLYPEFKGKIHVHLYDSTQLNAFALPNGSIYFNIGLLARIGKRGAARGGAGA
jgi:predicted Zn-dependent protease